MLSRALQKNETQELISFIARHPGACRNPYSGAALSADWGTELEVGDAQELADFALTKYYDPTEDNGLGGEWSSIEEELPSSSKAALLGTSVPLFDPGRQGSYFQTASQAEISARLLSTISNPVLSLYQALLSRAATKGSGVYVTF